jgi:DNA (cytosine-5)-methyltransferase 1
LREKREENLGIRVNADEKSMFDKVADSEGLATASWARRELLRAARQRSGSSSSEGARECERDLPLLSLFCGPGGLDEGFRQAGFFSVVAVDNDDECVRSFQLNNPSTIVQQFDITDLKLSHLDRWTGEEFRPLGVIGGPPCQSFSVSNVHQREDDPRHALPEAYARLVGELNERHPVSFFLFENVPGLLGKRHRHRYELFKRLFANAGFAIIEEQLDAQYYGVPQERPRIFIIGINRDLHPSAKWTTPTPEDWSPTVLDAIGGLPDPVFNGRGLDPGSFPVHPNHWCLVPRSEKFNNSNLQQGQMFGRSFRTLSWKKPSWTVAYGHREVHVHPDGKRRLSIYEAMLLQSFPKAYRLTGNMSAQIRLISEAVPPRLAWHIACSLRRSLGL